MPELNQPGQACDSAITPQAMAEFRRLFWEWRDSYPTCEALEQGGSGDLEALALRILAWAQARP